MSNRTKKDACDPVGFPLVEFVASLKKMTFTAIGGIKRDNINTVDTHEASTFCLLTDIISARDIGARIREIRSIMNQTEA